MFLVSVVSAAGVLAPVVVSKIRNGYQKFVEAMDNIEDKIGEKIGGLNISFPKINESTLELLRLYLKYQKLNNESNFSLNSSLLLEIKDDFDNETIQDILERLLALDNETREKLLKEFLGDDIAAYGDYFQRFGYYFNQTRDF